MTGILKYIAALLCALTLFSCTKVGFEHDYEVEEGLSTSTPITIVYDWSVLDSLSIQDKPDTMQVIMSRIVDEKHYIYVTDSTGYILTESITGKSDPSDSVTSVVENGAYYIMAFTYDPEDVSMNNLDQFSSSNGASMGDIDVSIPYLTDEKKAERYPDLTVDYNSSLEYIESISPIYYYAYKESFSSDDTLGVINLVPRPLTRQVIFDFGIALEGKVKVEKVFGSISGVTESINLMSGIIRDSSVYQTVIEFDISDEPVDSLVKDSISYHVYNMRGVLNSFGIVPPESSEDRRGPGIMNMTLKVSLDGDSHSFHVGFNLYEFIMEENFIEYQVDGMGHRLIVRNEPSYFKYGAMMYLSQELVLECTEARGAQVWNYDEDNNLDIEI